MSNKFLNPILTKRKKGFTLIELLVSATIIIVLTTIGVVSYRSASTKSRNSKRMGDLEAVRQALVLRRSETGCYPDHASDDFDAVVGDLQTDGYLSEGDFEDPGSNSYVYTSSSCAAGCCSSFTLTATLDDSTSYDISGPQRITKGKIIWRKTTALP